MRLDRDPYHAKVGERTTQTAKLFKNGRSQAVRLPAEFRFEDDEVEIRRDPETGDVILSPMNKSFRDWLQERDRLIASMTEEERKELDEFLAGRGDRNLGAPSLCLTKVQ